MMLEPIQAELARLGIHSVNLGVVTVDAEQIALRGSLLRYWKTPEALNAAGFLESLRRLPNGAGPAAVMNALFPVADPALPQGTK